MVSSCEWWGKPSHESTSSARTRATLTNQKPLYQTRGNITSSTTFLSFACSVQAWRAAGTPIPLRVVAKCPLTETPTMPLFVPVLRLAMLFLNVYDSYKTLKFPPPSSRRNDGLPSVRAMTQRKRDMKGCLAVWIVWVR